MTQPLFLPGKQGLCRLPCRKNRGCVIYPALDAAPPSTSALKTTARRCRYRGWDGRIATGSAGPAAALAHSPRPPGRRCPPGGCPIPPAPPGPTTPTRAFVSGALPARPDWEKLRGLLLRQGLRADDLATLTVGAILAMLTVDEPATPPAAQPRAQVVPPAGSAPRVVLRGRHEGPLVDGREKPPLTP